MMEMIMAAANSDRRNRDMVKRCRRDCGFTVTPHLWKEMPNGIA